MIEDHGNSYQRFSCDRSNLDLGIPITTISASLVHSKIFMTEHYSRVKNKQMDEAADKWSNF